VSKNKTVSFSQYQVYKNCNHQWYLNYVKKLQPFKPSIHLIFGTAFHETLQLYIETMYNKSGAAADELDLNDIFYKKFSKIYSEEYEKAKVHFTNAVEMSEFYDDALAILEWIKKTNNYFS
jgi:ATP-dependent helicase/DNAse subunit B